MFATLGANDAACTSGIVGGITGGSITSGAACTSGIVEGITGGSITSGTATAVPDRPLDLKRNVAGDTWMVAVVKLCF